MSFWVADWATTTEGGAQRDEQQRPDPRQVKGAGHDQEEEKIRDEEGGVERNGKVDDDY